MSARRQPPPAGRTASKRGVLGRRLRGPLIGVALTAALTAVTGWMLVGIAADHQLAAHLHARGQEVSLDQVRVFDACTVDGRTCVGDDRVQVVLPGSSTPVDLAGIGTVRGLVGQWSAPAPSSAYAAPLRVLVDPDDSSHVMAVADVDANRSAQTLLIAVVVWVLLGVVPLAFCVVLVVYLVRTDALVRRSR